MKLSDNAIVVLERRYLRKNEKGELQETPEQLFQRVSSSIARAELYFGKRKDSQYWKEQFFELLSNLYFIPNSPTLMNAGTRLGQLSACFVLPVEDSIDSIFTTLKQAALVQQSGGGTGFNFSQLRPKGDFVRSTSGTASGPVSFMKIYNSATEHIKQGGKRRGANMGILNIDHPDIEEFITSKADDGILSNFNISVGITDQFMESLESNETWPLVHPRSGKTVKKIKAKKLWQLLVQSAWNSGDPGLVFLDEINRHNPTPELGQIMSTNPCGEVPLLPYEACNLGSINLSRMVIKDGKKKFIHWERIENTVRTAIRFLDNVIEVNNYIIPEIEKVAKGNRKIGLGVMGWAEMLIHLKIPYDSESAVELGEKLMEFINIKSFEATVKLAKERSVFPNWPKSTYAPKNPVRNATRTCIAPTGTLSIIAGTSSSIEPLFGVAFERENILDDERLIEINALLVNHLREENLYSDQLLAQIVREGTLSNIDALPDETKRLFPTSHNIAPSWHIKHQVAFQKHTDNAVSKTINMPNNATVEEVDNAYKMAWKLKAKGITVFRSGSRKTQVLNNGIREFEPSVEMCRVCSD